MALGLTMVYGVMRVLHIAHAGVFTLGAYAGLVGFRWSGSFWIALLAAMVGAALLGLVMERWVYVPLMGQPPITTLIASIGVFIALEEIYRIVAGPEPYGFDVKLLLPDLRAAGLLVTAPQLLVALVTGTLLLALWLLLARTGVGLAIRAVSPDGAIAPACGTHRGRRG